MPEGDTILRTAHALHRALAGRSVLRFESVFPHLSRLDAGRAIRGRIVERVTAHGKHLLVWFSGALVLRSHMRMHGSWHLYRSGERWQRPFHEMRIVIGCDTFEAVAFSVPDAEFMDSPALARDGILGNLGPDVLDPGFQTTAAVERLRERGGLEIGEALLDQRALAGIGNIWKSESLFAARVNPFVRVADLPAEALQRVVHSAHRLMRASAADLDIRRRPWVYMRGGQPCRRCGTPVSRRPQGTDGRTTYWCESCQPRGRL